MKQRTEWDHYGSGYASYIDAWFYKPSDELKEGASGELSQDHEGLVVLLSRLSNYFVLMQGIKSWVEQVGERKPPSDEKPYPSLLASSYLPIREQVDRVSDQNVEDMAAQVQPLLERLGLVRLYKQDLDDVLPNTYPDLSTNLIEDVPCYFDALFYWED